MYNDLRGVDKPHFYARNDALINRQVPSSHGLTARKDEDNRERQRASDDDDQELNSWYAIDFGGSGLKSMAPSVFRYNFLKRIYFNHNRLNYLTPQIGTMRGLTVLDLSMNQLEMLPPEIGMLTNLKKLLLFDNHLVELPYEMGSLYQLEILGVEGNPLRDEFKDIIVEHGTAELIRYLREQAPSKSAERHLLCDFGNGTSVTNKQSQFLIRLKRTESGTSWVIRTLRTMTSSRC